MLSGRWAREGEEWSPFRAYSVRRSGHCDWAVFLLFLGIGIYLFHAAPPLPIHQGDWRLLGEFLIHRTESGEWKAGLLLKGLAGTFRLGIAILIFSLLPGAVTGILAARRRHRPFQLITLVMVLIRNTPPLVILFSVYFFAGNILPVAPLEDAIRALPPFWKSCAEFCLGPPGQLDRMLAAILGLGLYQAAHVAEIVRGSIESVPKGQWEAARSLGLGDFATLRLVILPQSAGIMIPPLTGQAISTFKDSALASLISVPELTFESLEIMAISNMTFALWLTTGLLYLGIGLVCGALGRWVEYKFLLWHIVRKHQAEGR